MTKFWAMMRDSFKEAVDGWIFPVMFVLAGLLILLVGSLSFDPAPAEGAVQRMLGRGGGPGGGGALQTVSPDKGTGSKLVIYAFRAEVTDVAVTPKGGRPWDDGLAFTVTFSSAGFGGGIEVDDAKNPKKVKVEGGGGGLANMFADPFEGAVRTWAGPTGGPKPKFTEEAATEFVAAQLKAATRLNITDVKKEGGKGEHRYRVTADGASTPLAWPHKPALFFGLVPMSFLEMPLGLQIQLVEDTLLNGLGAWVLLITGVIVTAGFIPNMLRKGGIDLLLTKPLARPTILLYKYLGGLLFVFLLTAFAVGGVWVAVGLRTGVWATGILYCTFGITFYFAILYAMSTLVGVLTRNGIVSIVVTIVFWFVVWLIGTVHGTLTVLDNLEVQRPGAVKKADPAKPADDSEAEERSDSPKPPRALVQTFDIMNRVTPRTKDLDTLTTSLIARDLLSEAEQRQAGLKLQNLNWAEVLGVAGAYIAVLLGLATLRFVTRSY